MLKHAIADLPPCPAERNFFYCPDPLKMTDEELEANFPRERRHEFLRDLGRVDAINPDCGGAS